MPLTTALRWAKARARARARARGDLLADSWLLKEAAFEVSIRRLSGDAVTVGSHPDWTVGMLKVDFAQAVGGRLVYADVLREYRLVTAAGVELDSADRTLSDYNIQSGDVLTLVICV